LVLAVNRSRLGNESPAHYRAKERIVKILQESGYSNIQSEVKQPETMLEFLGKRSFVADVQTEKEGRMYIFEVDGKRGHSTRRNISKDKGRDRSMVGIERWTIRIPTGYLVGKRKLSDREILEEIEYQTKFYRINDRLANA
jgi:hypothetical protein